MISIVVYVTPRSRRQSIQLDTSQRIKIHLKSNPEHGAANKELISYLAHLLNMPLRSINIVSGATSRTKRITIDTARSVTEIFNLLNLEVQHALV